MSVHCSAAAAGTVCRRKGKKGGCGISMLDCARNNFCCSRGSSIGEDNNLGVVANCGCGCGGGLECSREVGSTTEGGTTPAKGNELETTADFAAVFITGGLDSKLALWDFSKGRPNKIMDFGSGGNAGQCYNPAFVHALVVPDLDFVDSVGKICVVARGDGVVNVINLEPEHAAQKSKNTSKPKMGTKSQLKEDSPTVDQNDRNLHLDYSKGGHVAAVSSVSFSTFGEKGKLIISGGNDKSVKVWDWMKSHDGGGQTSNGSSDIVCSSITLSRKVNWLCTTPSDSENLVVCDTSKLVKVYTIG
ncbi:hypothetical protein SASPL_121475 [Salvia splendens]|uniref:Uncharacterized protein n=1 Tax=Salvia splendens TaxID=180675 RepID=A0A8X8XUX1_SALSN|nr:hypothetical protein SASPL_121475 [Salvia splendens]